MELWIIQLLESFPLLAIIVIIGILLFALSKGADIMVENAVKLATAWNIAKAVVGATIVSLGTTLPEVSVSVTASLQGQPELALANAIGSIIANTGLVVGVAACIKPIALNAKPLRLQSLIMMASITLIIVVSFPIMSSQGMIPSWVGYGLLALTISYLIFTFTKKEMSQLATTILPRTRKKDRWKFGGKMALGMVLIMVSARLLVNTVSVAAIRIGIPQDIIAATLIAFGTSLPELTTCIKSVQKGYGDLAIGNIIGANILNLLFVIGASASFSQRGLSVSSTFFVLHYPAMVLIVTSFVLFIFNKDFVIKRIEGLALSAFYLLYLLASSFINTWMG